MEYKEVFMIMATNLGNIYRNVFNIELLGWRKFLMAVIFSTLLGTIWMLYVQENHVSLWLALVIAVLLGMISNNIGGVIMSLGNVSEQKIGKIGAELIDTKLRRVVGLDPDKAEIDSHKQQQDGTSNH